MNKSTQSRDEFANKSKYDSSSPNLNEKPIIDILKAVNQEDRKVALAVEREMDSIIQVLPMESFSHSEIVPGGHLPSRMCFLIQNLSPPGFDVLQS